MASGKEQEQDADYYYYDDTDADKKVPLYCHECDAVIEYFKGDIDMWDRHKTGMPDCCYCSFRLRKEPKPNKFGTSKVQKYLQENTGEPFKSWKPRV
jgi:hypothetical protein